MTTNEKLKNKKWLYNQYIVKGNSISDIAKLLFGSDIKRTTIYNWLKNHNIKRRGFGGHRNQLIAAKKRKGKYSSWNKGTKGLMPSPWNKGLGKGYYIDKLGYKWVNNNGKFVAEHRLIMSQILKRSLKKGEIVHHKNKNRQDNSIKNLVLIKIGKPNAHNIECPKCKFNWLIK